MKIIKYTKYIIPVLIGLGILALIILVVIAATRDLSGLESVLLQIILLAIGSSISFFAGQQAVEKAAKPHARSAFRRLISLYNGLSRAAKAIESSQRSESDEDYQVLLARLREIVAHQLITADDALEDWRDIVSEDVKELKKDLQSDNTTEEKK